MKIHRPIIKSVVLALEQIFLEGYYADKVIERMFKAHKEWGARDRRLISEATYDCVRWWRRLWYSIGIEPDSSQEHYWLVVGAWLVINKFETPGWPEFAALNSKKIRERWESAGRIPAIAESVPNWLFDLGQKELGAQWLPTLQALNNQAPVFLRTNRLRTRREALLRQLTEAGFVVEPVPQLPDGIVMVERKNIFRSEAFKEGAFEVQDGASQMIAPLLQIEPGQRVVDACAGAGGKTLHIASLMQNKGKILALDLHEHKLDELKKRAARDGVDIIETKIIEGTKTIKRLENSADRLLLDVPCTGLGVLRRNPDCKWKLKESEVESLRSTQAEILQNYCKILKVGGLMVYATCSILPSENQGQVEKFLSANNNWELLEQKTFVPEKDGFDGFYAAVFKRLS